MSARFNRADYDTAEWHGMKAEVLAEAEYVCQICNGFFGPASVAHHVHYAGGVLNKDALVALCRECHQQIHNSSPYCERCGEFFWMEDCGPKARHHVGWDYRQSVDEPGLCVDCAYSFTKDD